MRLTPKGVQLVGVYNSQNESVKDMASHALEANIRFPVVKDTLQPDPRRKTRYRAGVPQVVVLDSDGRLLYRGRIDDQYRVGGTQPKVTREDLVEAIEELLAGKKISVSETPVDGCKITPWQPVEMNNRVVLRGRHQKSCDSLSRIVTTRGRRLPSLGELQGCPKSGGDDRRGR